MYPLPILEKVQPHPGGKNRFNTHKSNCPAKSKLSSMNSIGTAHAEYFPAFTRVALVGTPDRMLFIIVDRRGCPVVYQLSVPGVLGYRVFILNPLWRRTGWCRRKASRAPPSVPSDG